VSRKQRAEDRKQKVESSPKRNSCSVPERYSHVHHSSPSLLYAWRETSRLYLSLVVVNIVIIVPFVNLGTNPWPVRKGLKTLYCGKEELKIKMNILSARQGGPVANTKLTKQQITFVGPSTDRDGFKLLYAIVQFNL
jgi:hypothetical protein